MEEDLKKYLLSVIFRGTTVYSLHGVHEVHSTTDTRLPLFTNTDLEFVFHLNID